MKQRSKILVNPVSFKIRVVYNTQLLTMSLITIVLEAGGYFHSDFHTC